MQEMLQKDGKQENEADRDQQVEGLLRQSRLYASMMEEQRRKNVELQAELKRLREQQHQQQPQPPSPVRDTHISSQMVFDKRPHEAVTYASAEEVADLIGVPADDPGTQTSRCPRMTDGNSGDHINSISPSSAEYQSQLCSRRPVCTEYRACYAWNATTVRHTADPFQFICF